MDKAVMLEGGVVAGAEEIEAPCLQARDGLLHPRLAAGVVGVVPLIVARTFGPLGIMAVVAHMVYAQQHGSPAERVDHPRPSAYFGDMEESRGGLPDVGRETVARVRRERDGRLGDEPGELGGGVADDAAEATVRMHRRTSAVHGRLSVKRVGGLEDEVAGRILDGPVDALRIKRYRKKIFPVKLPIAGRALELHAQAVGMVRQPPSPAHFRQFAEVP